jgi:phospholipid/cholesterol/gamma-HCH transport system permease protein
MEYIDSSAGNEKVLALKGEWTIAHAAAIDKSLARYKDKARNILDARAIKKLDTAGVWLIRKYFPDAEIQNLSAQQKGMMDFVPQAIEAKAPQKTPGGVRGFMIGLGQSTLWGFDFIFAFFSFLGQTFIRIFKNLGGLKRFRPPSIARHIYETGAQALPIICLLAFGVSMVVSYQGATQLQKFGADIYAIDLTVISLLREMAVLTTAIMVAGRSGSAFAAEIGVMKMRGEIDALQTIGMHPFETLVVPRLLALLITLPALSFVADVVGLAGGGIMSVAKLDISLMQYINRVRTIATPTMFFVGMIKAPVFALLITAVCTYQGMSAKGSAENVGKLTTLAVVQSIFLVMMADALFSIVFSEVGI